VLLADNIYGTFLEVWQKKWSVGMPTNALLISGPSKTADIELTLASGVHRPRELIVLVVDEKAPRPNSCDQRIKDGSRVAEDENEQGNLRRSEWDVL